MTVQEEEARFVHVSPGILHKQNAGGERQTVTRRDLARSVFLACDRVVQSQAASLVDQVLDEIADAIVSGEHVTLCNFGKFAVIEKKERKGRNPRTGDFAIVRPRKAASFRPSRYLRAVVARGLLRDS